MTLIGRVLAGRYEIIEEVGNGGMAVVYKAKCQLLNRFVAVKVLRPDLQNDQEFVHRFNVEAQAAASLAHPNIVSIYDVGCEDGLHYIVMEFIEGKTLKEYIEEKRVLHWREAVEFTIQVAKGLEQAHKNSIIHRDVKPHNIIMTADGVLKVTDFGIARANVQSTVTCADTAIGSVHYISPEQARGGYTDERSDIYSLAVVLYEMITGRVPFDSDRPVTVAIMHLQDRPVNPREFNISIPLSLERIVLKAMSKEVSARYKNVSELISELQGVLGNTSSVNYFAASDEDVQDTSIEEVNAAVQSRTAGNASQFKRQESAGTTQQTVEFRNTSAGGSAMNETVVMPAVNVNKPPREREAGMENSAANGRIKTETVDEFESLEIGDMKKKKKPSVNKKTSRMVILAAILSAVLIVGGLVYVALDILGFFAAGNADVPSVPNVVGMLYDEAESEHENADQEGAEYKIDLIIKEKVVSDKPENTILDQSPEAGTKLRKGELTQVEVTVSTGSDKIVLEDYYNWKKEDAKVSLMNHGLVCEFDEVYSEDVEKGYVVSQSPAKESSVKKGTTVRLTVSLGSKEDETGIEVKNYIGESNMDAVRKAVEEQGFKAVFIKEAHETVKKGVIFEQAPVAGVKLEKGEEITLYVSNGPDANGDKTVQPPEGSTGDSSVKKKTKWLTVYGPKDKESSLVEVKMDGAVIFSKTLQRNANTLLKLESTRSKVEIEILYDGVSKQKNTVNLF
ncbi:MAG: Stk1 family PASTA domain-containing Ser/Thr kinase [Clostridia bacterium]|nr:Stk1 family PASTA domain-containing Ser/Thr kinase [Clostridia bacterium]